MIKRIRFATKKPEVATRDLEEAWSRVAQAAWDAPRETRPLRIALCTALPDVLADPKHDAIGIEWFVDQDHLKGFEAWLGPEDPLLRVLVGESSPVVVAEEMVLRGSDWLEGRWSEGDVRVKHMAIARRAGGLTPAQFSERWKGRAGQVRRPEGTSLVIPDAARGNAYVQNHPVPREDGDWAYDALNEVYFDDVDSLRLRIEWFARNLGEQTEEDLVSESWFVAAREAVLRSSPHR